MYRAHIDTVHDPRADLRLLVEVSLFLMLIALLPLLLWNGGLAEETAWRVASLGIAFLNAGYYAIRQRQVLASAGEQGWGSALRVYVALDWLLISLLVVNATGVLPLPPVVIYLVNMTYQLSGTALTFMRFIAPLWRPAV